MFRVDKSLRTTGIAGLLAAFAAACVIAADSPEASQKANNSTPAASNIAKSATGNLPASKSAPSKPTPVKTKASRPAAKTPAQLAAEREAAALAFAREHHPELVTLIEKLRKENRREYHLAIRDLSQASDRLARIKRQSPAQYEVALSAWKLDSRAHLLAARLTMSPDPALEAELKQVLRDRVDLRLQEYQFERDRIQKRLVTLGTLIRQIETDRAAVAQKDFDRVKQMIARNRRTSSKKPAHSPAQSATPQKPVVAERPQLPSVPSAASVVPPRESSGGANKPKQE
jgi:hypothetical protein